MHEIDEDILRAAKETYDLEAAFGLNESALRTALSAALVKHEQQVIKRIADGAVAYADRIEEEEDCSYEASGSLRIFAAEIESEIPKLKEEYIPSSGDIASITLTGEITRYVETCPNCSKEYENSWSVTDRYTNQEIFFEDRDLKRVHLRVISRNEPLIKEI